ncbi:hypothetical protein GALMADRAFT_803589 [Galerina marginata CBS 339.88]|uniref:Uncharacterized protein n=1 Tax=Galerina marginata (strain CBS 339.88) TaxID=685588 RepID=A0A067SJE4_GALM3|nr:hypothetical protein GALMADRAFT_803589 [Galerina marginata CBS 339.88]
MTSDAAAVGFLASPPPIYRSPPRRLSSRNDDIFPQGVAVDNGLLSNAQRRDSEAQNDARGDGQHFLQRMLKTLSNAFVLPASKVLHSEFRYIQDEETPEPRHEDFSVSEENVQWAATMEGILFNWRMIRCGSAVLLASVLAVLQIQPIFNSVSTRTFTVAALMLVCASAICGTLYMASIAMGRPPRLHAFCDEWKAAAKPNAEFWKLVALPFAFFMWSFVFFMITLFILVWNTFTTTDADQGGVKSTVYYLNFVVSGLFLTSIPIISGYKIYHAIQKIRLISVI